MGQETFQHTRAVQALRLRACPRPGRRGQRRGACVAAGGPSPRSTSLDPRWLTSGSRAVMVGLVTTRKSDRSGVVAPLDVRTLLASVEAAPPIDAAEVVAAALTDALGARDVSFLIADYSGRALIRLSHVRRVSADDEDVNRERGQSVALAGTPHGRALAEQEVQIVPDSDGFRVFAPVTSRGEAVGVLELGFDDEPDQQTLATVSAGAHALAYIVIANRRFTDLVRLGPAFGASFVGGRAPAPTPSRLVHLRGGPVHAGRMAGTGRRRRRRHVRLQRRARHAAPLDD